MNEDGHCRTKKDAIFESEILFHDMSTLPPCVSQSPDVQ